MPNWVQNVVTLEGGSLPIENLKAFIKSADSLFDFNKVIPMPPNIEDWYIWRVQHWGTKWSASEVEIQGNVIKFQTPWTPPKSVIDKLASLFTTIRFSHIWADEAIGQNTGEAIYCVEDGERSVIFFAEWSESAKNTYRECWGE